MSNELVTWLRAQLDEDEQIAREALHPDAVKPGVWTTEHHNAPHHAEPNRCHIAEDRGGNYWTVAREVFIPNAEHMARHDPARVLAEVDAKRRILASIATVTLSPWPISVRPEYVEHLNQLLRLLALPYGDRPGYQDTWRP